MQFNSEIIQPSRLCYTKLPVQAIEDAKLDHAVSKLISDATPEHREAKIFPGVFPPYSGGWLQKKAVRLILASAEADINYVAKAPSTGATTGSIWFPPFRRTTLSVPEARTDSPPNRSSHLADDRNPENDRSDRCGSPNRSVFAAKTPRIPRQRPILGQISFDLKTRRSLTAVPAELLPHPVRQSDSC